MYLSDLYGEIAESIRVHHASGHFDREEAMGRLVNGCSFSSDEAAQILAQPVGADLFAEYKTWPAEGIDP